MPESRLDVKPPELRVTLKRARLDLGGYDHQPALTVLSHGNVPIGGGRTGDLSLTDFLCEQIFCLCHGRGR
jgi:hypothetical protein